MHNRELLGYSIYFKELKDAEQFYRKVPSSFSATLDKDEKEVTIIDPEPLLKDEAFYYFIKGKEKAKAEMSKVVFIQSLYARE